MSISFAIPMLPQVYGFKSFSGYFIGDYDRPDSASEECRLALGRSVWNRLGTFGQADWDCGLEILPGFYRSSESEPAYRLKAYHKFVHVYLTTLAHFRLSLRTMLMIANMAWNLLTTEQQMNWSKGYGVMPLLDEGFDAITRAMFDHKQKRFECDPVVWSKKTIRKSPLGQSTMFEPEQDIETDY
jgi:hypothetical protein